MTDLIDFSIVISSGNLVNFIYIDLANNFGMI